MPRRDCKSHRSEQCEQAEHSIEEEKTHFRLFPEILSGDGPNQGIPGEVQVFDTGGVDVCNPYLSLMTSIVNQIGGCDERRCSDPPIVITSLPSHKACIKAREIPTLGHTQSPVQVSHHEYYRGKTDIRGLLDKYLRLRSRIQYCHSRRLPAHFRASQPYSTNSHQSPLLPPGFFRWITPVIRTKDEVVIRRAGLDAFMFLRFLRMGAVVFSFFTLIGIPIMFPVNIVNQRNLSGINVATIANVSDPSRLWAHLIMAVIFVGFTIWLTFREMRSYVDLRHRYLTLEERRESVAARTLLVCSLTPELTREDTLQKLFDKFPGGVEKVWLNRKLESAELKFIKASVQHFAANGAIDMEKNETPASPPQNLRPTQSTSMIPFAGQKVDAIEHLRQRLTELNASIETRQKSHHESASLYTSAFIQFRLQISAHMAAQSLMHHESLRLAPRYIEVSPSDVIWGNLNMGAYERMIKKFWSTAAVSAITLLWAIPVAFVASIASLNALAKILPFLSVLNKLPVVVGIIQGILPTVALAILLALVPIVFRMLSSFEGIPRHTSVTLSLMHKYFFFLVVNVLLVTTLAGGIFNTLPDIINNPTGVVFLLAKNLPAASTFFISYVLLATFTGAASEILQLVPLILNYVFVHFLAATPRDYWNIMGTLGAVDWGVLFPQQTLIFGIGLLYSCVSPLILPFVALYFILRFVVYRHQFLYVYKTQIETGGLAFPRAIKHVYTALFIFELTMIGLFFLNSAFGPGVIMVIILFATIVAITTFDKIFKPLIKYLPVDMAIENKTTIVKEEAGGKTLPQTTKDTHGGAFDISQVDMDAEDPEATEHVLTRSQPEPRQTVTRTVRSDGAIEEIIETTTTEQYTSTQTTTTHERKSVLSESSTKNGGLAFAASATDEHYHHPAVIDTQKTIWLPEDEFGVAKTQVAELLALGFRSSIENAKLHRVSKGKKQKLTIVLEKEVYEGPNRGVPGEDSETAVWSSQYADAVETGNMVGA
ncbi:hypothetical protein BC937DRAFT_89315 [Endogone sp. FLAS-F59071]|nr:hypothetical protein BC937DRAFT_89315 [Endogone sp. FLAS-F59071]|eukprot:RUS17953.1 hypothetical protein BC937DRAFT_89315 [Endogone sp. FLAS-F59071]